MFANNINPFQKQTDGYTQLGRYSRKHRTTKSRFAHRTQFFAQCTR